MVIISGSLPPGMEADWYSKLIRKAHAQGCKVFLDTSGEALRSGLDAGPDFVKPNRHEAEELTGVKISDSQSAENALRKVIQAGAKSAAISLGENGLVYCSGMKEENLFCASTQSECEVHGGLRRCDCGWICVCSAVELAGQRSCVVSGGLWYSELFGGGAGPSFDFRH